MEKERNNNVNILYLIILIILIIFTFVISFKTGENIYNLVNTNLGNQDTVSNTKLAKWSFIVRIKY